MNKLLAWLFKPILLMLEVILMNQVELARQLEELTVQNEKARAEIVARIAELEAALENAGTVSPEVTAALDALKASVQADDDMHADPTEPV
jgi:hypothetical protein